MARLTLSAASQYLDRITGGVFPLDDRNQMLNEGYAEFCRKTGVLFTRSTPAGIQDIASTATYTLPTDTAQVERLSYRNRTIFPLNSEILVQLDAQALSTEGTVVGYILDGDGTSTIRKFRVPAATDASSLTAIEYQNLPATLTSSVGFQIPPYMVRYIVWYAAYRLLRRNGVAQDLKFSDHFHGRFLEGVRRTLVRKSKFTSRRTGVLGGGPTTRRIPIGPRLPWNYGPEVR